MVYIIGGVPVKPIHNIDNGSKSDSDNVIINKSGSECVSFFKPEIPFMTTTIVGRHLGYTLANYDYIYLANNKMNIIYNLLINNYNHILLWCIDKIIVDYTFDILSLEYYRENMMSLIKQARYGYILYKMINIRYNDSDFRCDNVLEKTYTIGNDIGKLSLKMMEIYAIYQVEKYLYNTDYWLVNFGLITLLHFNYNTIKNGIYLTIKNRVPSIQNIKSKLYYPRSNDCLAKIYVL